MTVKWSIHAHMKSMPTLSLSLGKTLVHTRFWIKEIACAQIRGLWLFCFIFLKDYFIYNILVAIAAGGRVVSYKSGEELSKSKMISKAIRQKRKKHSNSQEVFGLFGFLSDFTSMISKCWEVFWAPSDVLLSQGSYPEP